MSRILVRLPVLVLGVALAGASLAAAPLRVLFFTKSAGFEHGVIKQVDGKPSYAENVLTRLGAAHDLAFTFSKDGSLFSRDYLAQFDVVFFYTSGDLLSVGTDKHPAMTPAGKQALFDYVAAGKGFVAVHSGSDCFHTGESGGGNPPAEKRGHRYHNDGDAADPYVKFLGGEFIRHGAQQVARALVPDPKFPGCEALGAELKVMEEWYTLKNFAADLHVTLVMQTEGMTGPDYARPPYPLAWARTFGQGRVAFNAMGHREDVWDSAAYQAMLVGMLEWAGGRRSADVTPNLSVVAPAALQLQARPADVK